MNLMGLQGGQYAPLSEKQVETLHNAALTILENTGITYESGLDDTVALLEKSGAAVDRDKRRIRLPQDMVSTWIKKASQEVVLCGQNSEYDLHLTEDRVHLGTGGAAIKILDPDTGDVRATTLDDLHKVSRLVDQLKHIHFLVRPCIPTDIDEKDYDINMF
ncbi:MAG TPA: trimethylamine methyltransferase family protein, partial [Desulfotignum sp.]|nr:trimethylamine methyltransferase family protein [Desulfotignum sp.]